MSSKVDEFCDILGCDSNTAKSFLDAYGGDLEVAVNMFMSHSNATVSQEYLPHTSSVHQPARSPKALRSRNQSAFSRRRIVVADENVVQSVDLTSEEGSDQSPKPSSITNDHAAEQDPRNQHSSSSKKEDILGRLFAPPSHILFRGSLREAIQAARNQKRWLLVSIHDEACFDCHVLNRDVWKDHRVADLIKNHMVFVQLDVNAPDGVMYRSHFSYVNSAVHIAIINPVTGVQEMFWTHLKTPDIVFTVLSDFILLTESPKDPDATSPKPSTSTSSVARLRRLRRRHDSSEEEDRGNSKRPRFSEVSSLTSYLASVSVSPLHEVNQPRFSFALLVNFPCGERRRRKDATHLIKSRGEKKYPVVVAVHARLSVNLIGRAH
ncbi:unnamed protein product [Mesocestoides corti]|uniref:UAS domain-containing protein n=2 Tax=Mesocestoides corti TaxID=53468 RepID=A0A0R3U3B9_MESCO|nr:unnamed protein product [Mesocestoides corti]